MDFRGRTSGSLTEILSTDPSGTSIGLGKLTGGSLGVYNVCIGLRAAEQNTGNNNVVIGAEAASEVGGPVSSTVVVGYSAGKHVSLDGNTFVGNRSGELCAKGSLNAGFGSMSLNGTLNGWFNVGVGNSALLLNQNGNQNVAVGNGCMQNVKNSNDNTACGNQAAYGLGSAPVAGGGNCAFGSKALYNLGSAKNVVAVGTLSGYKTVSAEENVMVGFKAGFSNVSATGLLAIGSGAAMSHVEGDIVSVGHRSGEQLVSGEGNTLVGNGCMRFAESGSHNTHVGAGAGGVSGSNNVSLGSGSLAGSSASESIAIGRGSGVSSSGDSSLSIGSGAGCQSSGSECIYIGGNMGRSVSEPLTLQIGMSVGASRPPLITGNLDTSDTGKPGITCRGNIRIRQNRGLGDSFADNGLLMYRNDDAVNTAWNLYVDDTGNWVFGKDGRPAAVMEGEASLPDIPCLDFTGQHRCRPSEALMAMARSGKTSLGLPIAGSVVVSSGAVCTPMGKRGEVYCDKRGIAVSQSLPGVDLSAKPRDKAVFGVVSGIESCTEDGASRTYNTGTMLAIFEKEPGDDRLVINSLGEGAIWVCNAGYETVENGDYVTSSHLPGVAMKQKSDTLRNCTVAKLTVGCDFSVDSSLFECVEVTHMGIRYRCALLACTYHCG